MNKNDINKLRKIMGTLPDEDPEFKTVFYNGVTGMKDSVKLIDYSRNPYKAMYVLATSCWGKKIDKWEDTSLEGKYEVIKAVLTRNALPLALEAPHFTFAVENIPRWAFDQIARARVGIVFSSRGTRDNSHLDAGFFVHDDIWENEELRKDFIEAAKKCKDVYKKIVEQGISNWQSARSILPISNTHAFSFSCNFAALQNMLSKRMKFCLMPGTKIITENGLKNIEDISIGERVLTHLGEFKKVIETISNDCYSDIYNISYTSNFKLYTFNITGNHKVYGIKKEVINKISNNEIYNKLDFIKVEELNKGDFVAFPIIDQDKKFTKKYEISKICGIIKFNSKYTGKVYNLEVEEHNSYCTMNCALHNCEADATVAFAWLCRKEVEKVFPLLAKYLFPSCDLKNKCEYAKSYYLSNCFGRLFKPCGRNKVDDDVSDYASINTVCSDREKIMKQLGIYIPTSEEIRNELKSDELSSIDIKLLKEK